ncbi:MAG: DsbA family protein [Caulobacteraceae bacterium]|nr:DsbA family protein [Caulobacteraceae bacterium]
MSSQLIYFSDPMCSWCWGFSPVIADVQERFGFALPIRLIMGGLRPGTTTPMTDEARAELRGHWRQVTEASGQPFGQHALSMSGFVYDTDPAARAVVLVRKAAPGKALAFLTALQRAFYVDGADVTDLEVLAGFAAAFGLDRGTFLEAMRTEEAKQETWRDYAISQKAGVTGFPTLVMGPRPDGAYVPITRGFAPAETVLSAIGGLLEVLGTA